MNIFKRVCYYEGGFPEGARGKESICQCRRCGFDPWGGKIPTEGNGNPLLYSSLGNPMDRGTWQAIVHGVTSSQIQLSDWAHTHTCARTHVCYCERYSWIIPYGSKNFLEKAESHKRMWRVESATLIVSVCNTIWAGNVRISQRWNTPGTGRRWHSRTNSPKNQARAMAVCTGNPPSGKLGMLLEAEWCLYISSGGDRERQKQFKRGKITITKEYSMNSNLICLQNQSQKHYILGKYLHLESVGYWRTLFLMSRS